MADCDFSFHLHIGEEWPLVIDFEGEDTMLIGSLEGGAEDRAIGCLRDGLEVEAVER